MSPNHSPLPGAAVRRSISPRKGKGVQVAAAPYRPFEKPPLSWIELLGQR